MRKAQAWSTDIMIAGAIFIVGIIIFLYIIGGASQTRSLEALLKEANVVSDFVVSGVTDECSFVDNNILSSELLARCAQVDYSHLKSKVGVKGDFCIHFEDDKGNLINISGITNRTGIGIGDGSLPFMVKDQSGVVVASGFC
ncbi:MAG: hypothetical protein V1735_00930 [Nanoarchaeota archaeon]